MLILDNIILYDRYLRIVKNKFGCVLCIFCFYKKDKSCKTKTGRKSFSTHSGMAWKCTPHPVILFIILIAILLVSSAVGEYFGVTVQDPRPKEGAKGRAEDGYIHIISLLDADGIRRILANIVTNFTGFAPLGTVLVALLGVGIAERAGLLSAVMRLVVMKAPTQNDHISRYVAGIMSKYCS